MKYFNKKVLLFSKIKLNGGFLYIAFDAYFRLGYVKVRRASQGWKMCRIGPAGARNMENTPTTK